MFKEFKNITTLTLQLILTCKILAQQGTIFEVIISEQINMNLSNNRGKKTFVSLQFCFYNCILNIVPIALIALEAAIKRKGLL